MRADPPARRGWPPVGWGIAVAACCIVGRLVIAAHLGDARHAYDISRYYQIARSHGRPYVDYAIEYPPMTVVLLRIATLFTHGRGQFGLALVWLNVATDLGIAAVLLWGWGRVASLFYLVTALSLCQLIDIRADTASTLVATLGVAALVRRRPGVGGAAIGIGALTKLWPAPLALLGLGLRRDHDGPLFSATAMATMALGGAAWLAVGGIGGITQVLTYRHSQGWEVGTIPGVVLLALRHGGAHIENGAYRIGGYGPAFRFLLWGTSVPLAAWSAHRGARMGRIGLAWIGSVGSLLVVSALLSPQFILWLVPAAAIAWVEGDRLVAAVVAVCAPLTGIEMLRLHWLLEARPSWLLLVGGRDVLLVAAVALAVHRLRAGTGRGDRRGDAVLVASGSPA